MGKTAKNIAFILGLATVAFGGYYLFTQMNTSTSFSTDDQTMQNMLNNTRVFIEREAILREMSFDFAILENDSFNSLQSFRRPVQPRPIGKPNPFSDTPSSANTDVILDGELTNE